MLYARLGGLSNRLACGAPEGRSVPACCRELRGVGRGCFIGQRRVRPSGVVVLDPLGDRLPGLVEREEQGLVQQLVPHLAIEAFNVAILRKRPVNYAARRC
jgi:hypothetical protein